jgi:hypothetical protein
MATHHHHLPVLAFQHSFDWMYSFMRFNHIRLVQAFANAPQQQGEDGVLKFIVPVSVSRM